MNKIMFVGRLTKDPLLEKSSSGNVSYCRFTLAIDRGRSKDGEKETDFPSMVCFGKTAENLEKFTEKGNLIAVDGALHTRKYEKDGKTYYTDEIIANRVEFLQWKKSSKEEPPALEPAEIPQGFEKIEENAKSESKLTDDDLPF